MQIQIKKYYAGIGSRSAPENILVEMTKLAQKLEQVGFILRSGGAKGSDLAFERGVSLQENKEIFCAKDADNLGWAHEMVSKYLPEDRKNFATWQPYVKNLLARNMMQLFGKNGDLPVKFVICWTPNENYKTSEVGGTGYAIRAALDHKIKVFNLVNTTERNQISTLL